MSRTTTTDCAVAALRDCSFAYIIPSISVIYIAQIFVKFELQYIVPSNNGIIVYAKCVNYRLQFSNTMYRFLNYVFGRKCRKDHHIRFLKYLKFRWAYLPLHNSSFIFQVQNFTSNSDLVSSTQDFILNISNRFKV